MDFTFNTISLCAGVGGLDLGVRLAVPSSRTVCYVEIEAFPIEVLVSRMEDKTMDKAPIWTDCKTFDGVPWRGKVDCIIGGYPCQPFSVAGKQQGEDDPRHLWPHIARILGEVKPEWCFFENVENHLKLGFRDVRDELRGLGYEVAAGVFSAEEVGAPHQRRRLFILAHSKRLGRRGGSEVVRRSEVRRGGSPQDQAEGSIGELAYPAVEGLEGREWEINQGSGGRPPTQSEVLGSMRVRSMANSNGNGRRSGRAEATRGDDTKGWEERLETFWTSRADAKGSELSTDKARAGEVDDTNDEGLERYRNWRDANKFPSWPPSPSSDEWHRERPTLEPAICGVVDGVDPWMDGSIYSNRVERLRAVGNGVVPITAALAFVTLAEELGYEIQR